MRIWAGARRATDTGVVLVVMLAVAISACGGSSPRPEASATQTEAAATPSTAITPTAESTPDLAALSETYLALARASNLEVCRFNQVWSNNAATTGELRAASTAVADALRLFDDGLRNETWPPPLDISVRDLIVAHGAVEAAFLSAASLTEYAAVVAEINRAIDANSAAAAAATVVRGDLGVEAAPGVPTDC